MFSLVAGPFPPLAIVGVKSSKWPQGHHQVTRLVAQLPGETQIASLVVVPLRSAPMFPDVVRPRFERPLGGTEMATRLANMRAVFICAAWLCVSLASLSFAEESADKDFRAYPLRSASPEAIEDSLRSFLSARVDSGETIEVVSDVRKGRLLVRGGLQTSSKWRSNSSVRWNRHLWTR